jgi:hypothetical protein
MIGATEERKQMTFNELRFAIEELLPGAQLDEDNEGQIVVYTDLMIDASTRCRDSEVVPFVEEEDQS